MWGGGGGACVGVGGGGGTCVSVPGLTVVCPVHFYFYYLFFHWTFFDLLANDSSLTSIHHWGDS